MTNEEALFFAEMWLSDKCNKSNNVMYQFMVVAFEALKQEHERIKKEAHNESNDG